MNLFAYRFGGRREAPRGISLPSLLYFVQNIQKRADTSGPTISVGRFGACHPCGCGIGWDPSLVPVASERGRSGVCAVKDRVLPMLRNGCGELRQGAVTSWRRNGRRGLAGGRKGSHGDVAEGGDAPLAVLAGHDLLQLDVHAAVVGEGAVFGVVGGEGLGVASVPGVGFALDDGADGGFVGWGAGGGGLLRLGEGCGGEEKDSEAGQDGGWAAQGVTLKEVGAR